MENVLTNANDYKAVYELLPEYQALHIEADKVFFDNIFLCLLIDKVVVRSNKELAARFNMSESTLEKRLKRLEDAKLIIRSNVKTHENGYWEVLERAIELDPFTFAKIKEQALREKAKLVKDIKNAAKAPAAAPTVKYHFEVTE